jgi:outer membrane immunogenic protein
MGTLGHAMEWYRIAVRALPAACAMAVIAALPGARALAADLPSPPPPVAVPVAPPARAVDWSGPYLGLGLGVRANAVDATVESASVGTPPVAIPVPPVSSGSGSALAFWQQNKGAHQYLDHISLRGAFYGGWNYQVAPAYVIGIEADFGIANELSVHAGSPYPVILQFGTPTSIPFGASSNDTFGARTTWDASLRLRGGWLATPQVLFYLTGGLAVAHLEATSVCSTVPNPAITNCAPGNYFGGTLGPAIISHSATKLGWTAGIGSELWLWPNWVARGQYRYSDFGYLSPGAFSFTDTRTCTGCPPSANPLSVAYQLRLMQHNFELGLAYKF